jgi:hypothetical protein
LFIYELQNWYNANGKGRVAGISGTQKSATGADSGVYIAEDPEYLANQAGVPVDVYSLARLGNSEGYGGVKAQCYAYAQVAIMQAIKNQSRRAGKSITRVLTNSTAGAPRQGHYGRQKTRFASTIQPATEFHIKAARAVYDNDVANLIGTAHKFFDPKTQDGGMQAGEALRRDAIDVVRQWHSEGNAYIGDVVGIDSYHLMFLKRESDPTIRAQALTEAIKVIQNGQDGYSSVASFDESKIPAWQPSFNQSDFDTILETCLLALRRYFTKGA